MQETVFLLDAFSQTVSEAVDMVGSSGALVRMLDEGRDKADGDALGSGSGFIFTPDVSWAEAYVQCIGLTHPSAQPGLSK